MSTGEGSDSVDLHAEPHGSCMRDQSYKGGDVRLINAVEGNKRGMSVENGGCLVSSRFTDRRKDVNGYCES